MNIFFIFAFTLFGIVGLEALNWDWLYKLYIFKSKVTPKSRFHYEEVDETLLERNVDPSCECGKYFKDSDKEIHATWNVYISSRPYSDIDMPLQPATTCIGAIITSNLIATSHNCIFQSNSSNPNATKPLKLNPYNAWGVQVANSKNEPIFKKSDVIISTDVNGEGEVFRVEQFIIYSDFVYMPISNLRDSSPNNDLLLIKVAADFTTHKILRPVCLPSGEQVDLIGQISHYYGGGEVKHPKGNLIPHVGVIQSTESCEMELLDKTKSTKSSANPTLCVRWAIDRELNTLTSSPLIINEENNDTAFIVGIQYDSKYNQDRDGLYAYFTNLISMTKYIEYKAWQHHSSWCKSPELELGRKSEDDIFDWTTNPCEGKEEKAIQEISDLQIMLYKIQYYTDSDNEFYKKSSYQQELQVIDGNLNDFHDDVHRTITAKGLITHTRRIDMMDSINSISAFGLISSVENATDITDFHAKLLSSFIREAYEPQVHSHPYISEYTFAKEVEFIHKKRMKLKICQKIKTVYITIEEIRNLEYVGYVKISGVDKTGKPLRTDVIKKHIPSELEYVEDENCFSVIARGKSTYIDAVYHVGKPVWILFKDRQGCEHASFS